MNIVYGTVLEPSAGASAEHTLSNLDRMARYWLIEFVFDNAGEIITGTGECPLDDVRSLVIKNRYAARHVHNGGTRGAIPHATTLSACRMVTSAYHENILDFITAYKAVINRHLGLGVVVHRPATPKALRGVVAQNCSVDLGFCSSTERDASTGFCGRVRSNVCARYFNLGIIRTDCPAETSGYVLCERCTADVQRSSTLIQATTFTFILPVVVALNNDST